MGVVLMNFENVITKLVTHSVLHTIVAGIAVSIGMLMIFLLFRRKFDTPKKLSKFRSRLIYIGICIFVVILVQVWVEGFSRLFTMLGLVAAGLVISNKETIMNFAGFLIINWRGIFTEGDFIQIQGHIGYVDSIRPLCFKLYETTNLDQQQATGRAIKVPNSLVITTPVMTFSPQNNVVLQQLKFVVSWGADNSKSALEIAEKTINSLIESQYKGDKHYTSAYISKRNKGLGSLVDLTPKVYAVLPQGQFKGLQICVDFYVYADHSNAIENAFWQSMQYELQLAKVSVVV